MFGDWTALTVFLYVLGLILLIIEGIIPGFGVPGITGVICVIISVALITSNLYEALLLIITTIALFILAVVLLYKLGYGSKYLKFLILNTEQKKEEGYTSVKLDSSYIGKIGIAETILRPAGIVSIEDKRINAQSRGEFIEKGSKVVVIETDGMKITVKRLEKED
ncbi:MAG: serine protease [Gottschalkiaceae bacterium]|nr:MAG: serine protease [Gottschalkiaceae bacterium]